MELKNDTLKITIKKSNTYASKYVEIKCEKIKYYSKDKNTKSDNAWIEPQLISDEQFITKIIKELYFSVIECIKNYKQELENIEPSMLIRPKNTSRYDFQVLDEGFCADLDLYITQTPKVIYDFCENVIEMVEKQLEEKSLKEKNISLNELIKISTQPDFFWEMKLKEFFNNLSIVSEKEKIEFLKKLLDNRERFNEFTKEVNRNHDSSELFNKYNI